MLPCTLLLPRVTLCLTWVSPFERVRCHAWARSVLLSSAACAQPPDLYTFCTTLTRDPGSPERPYASATLAFKRGDP